MLFRGLAVLALIVVVSLPASGLTLFPLPDPALQEASKHVRNKQYAEAQRDAMKAGKSGIREFVLGMTAVRLEQWQEATEHLPFAAEDFPVLGDYALYNHGLALSKLGRHAESLEYLRKMLKIYPESPVRRQAYFLLGNELFETGAFDEALKAYTDFIEAWPQGADSLAAMYKSALCREQKGDLAAAASILRSIRLNYPASSLSPKAGADLERLETKGIKQQPFTAAEMLQQGTTLLDLGKHQQAIETFDAAVEKTNDAELTARLRFKKGQALFKSRRYKDAETVFAALADAQLKKGADDALFWLARSMDRNGKSDEAAAAYLKITDTWPRSPLADDALLNAAQIRMSRKKTEEGRLLLQKSLSAYPESALKKNVLWEMGWERYQSRDYKEAAEWFAELAGFDGARDRALYWLGKARAGAGDMEGAKASFYKLISEYPLGYYALNYKKEVGLADAEPVLPPRDLADALPLPAGYERIKALIALGFHEEASKELAGQKKPKTLQAIARLYLEMGNYNAVVHLFNKERSTRLDKDSALLWGVNHPLAFKELVAKYAAESNLPESLVYAIIKAESTYSPTALSPVGAVGLMQLMPATAKAVAGVAVDRAGLTTPDINIRYGSRHLKDLLAYHNGDLVKTIAAYNAGSGNVGKWEKRLGQIPPEEFVENIPFGETKEYVKKVVAGMELYRRFYGLDSKQEKPIAPPVENAAAAPEKVAVAPQAQPELVPDATATPDGKQP
jgi:soluble lytic murein transglycosylase